MRPNATSVQAPQHAAGNRTVTHLPQPASRAKTAAHDVPWLGQVPTSWNAALRRRPQKDAEDPYANIIADVPHGTTVTVLGTENGWLQAEVLLDGKTLTGYISHELIRYTRPAYTGPVVPQILTIDMGLWSIPAAFVALKRAENRAANLDWAPSADERRDLDRATDTLERTNRYSVDRTTFVVSFVPASTGGKVKVETIADFILFVETVERAYPHATPGEIAGEIRQIWFGGANWEALLNSPGVTVRGKAADIEHEPDPIAAMFNITALKSSGHKLVTALGDVDISHVLAGIDAALNGAAPAPADAGLKTKTLRAADAGDPRDFATWSGDIGQAYAEYLVSRYIDDSRDRLQAFVERKAAPEQLLGDIHGYIATKVWMTTPPNVGSGWWTAGQSGTVSNILRTLYLIDKRGSAGSGTRWSFVEHVSGKSGTELRDFIRARALAFARPWYAKVAASERGSLGSWLHDPSLSYQSALSGLMNEFDHNHAENEGSAVEADRLGAVVDRFLVMLGENL